MNYFQSTRRVSRVRAAVIRCRPIFVAVVLPISLLAALLLLLRSQPALALVENPPTAEPGITVANLYQSGQILYVTSSGSGTTCSMVAPCSLATAMNEADNGDEVRVAAGTYSDPMPGGGGNQTLFIDKGVAIRGGFTPDNWQQPDPAANPTILDGVNERRVVFHTTASGALLEGFLIENGATSLGGGIYVASGQLTIQFNELRNNVVGESGGGIYIASPGEATLLYNRVHNNQANGNSTVGGGVYISGNAFLDGNLIYFNQAGFGGGIFLFVAQTTILQNNFIYHNIATNSVGGGGGISSQSSGQLNIWHNTIVANQATGNGGGGIALYEGDVDIRNNIVASNTAAGENTGIYNWGGNAIITGGYNNLFNNSANVTLDNPVAGDPLFVDPDNFDFHLQSGGPMINAADPDSQVFVDVDRQPRPFNGGFDVGADEHYPPGLNCFVRLNDGDVYGDIQTVVDLAAAGDTVKVAGHCTGSGTAVVEIAETITLRGGYTLTNWTETDRGSFGPTIIDGENGRRLIQISGGNPTIDSLHLTGGNAANGAAVFVTGGSASLQNNVIYANSSTNGIVEGAIGAALNLQFNTIADNSGQAVTMLNGTVQNSILFGNSNNNIGGGSGHVYNLIGVDPLFVDAANDDYRITAESPALAAADPNAALSYDFEGDPRPRGRRADIGADEANDYPAAFFTPAVRNQDVERGNVVALLHTLENDGTLTGDWFISATQVEGWEIAYPTEINNLAPGQSVQVSLVVTVPVTALPGIPETITLTAVSQINANALATAVNTLHVIPIYGLQFTPSYSDTLLPGEVISYVHTLTNTGEFTDTFRITKVSDTFGWGQLYQIAANPPFTPTLVPGGQYQVTLPASGSAQAMIVVTVPEFAPAGLANTILLEARSLGDESVLAIVADTVTAKATAGTRYVSTLGSDVNNNCRVIDNPCRSVGRGVNQAAVGDEVRIAFGVYNESETAVNATITVRGSWNNAFTEQDSGATIIQANGLDRLFNISGSSSHPIFEKLTLRDGNRTSGGAVLVRNGARPTFSQITFEDNQAQNGGAIYLEAGTQTVIEKSIFRNNQANVNGAAVWLAGTLIAPNNLFTNNSANGHGGAYYLSSAAANAVIWHNTLDGNSAGQNGGALYQAGGSALLRNSSLTNNNAANGGAIYRAGGGLTMDYNNVWNNSAPASNDPLGANSVSRNPDYNDSLFRLSPISPILDIGDPNSPLDEDFEDNPRPSDQGFDIGWYELAGCRARRDGVIYYGIQEAITAGGSPYIQVSGICRGVNTIDAGSGPISQTVHLNESLHIQGGWNSDFDNNVISNPQPTFVDPQGLGRGFYIYGNAEPTIEAIAVLNGDAAGLDGGPNGEDAGGGVYIAGGSPTFSQLRVYSSTAVLGGGVYNHAGDPYFTVLDNVGLLLSNSGGVRANDLAYNNAQLGGGLYSHAGSLQFDKSFVRWNEAQDGAGLYLAPGATMNAANSVLYDNEATGNGGAIFNAAPGSFWHLTYYQNSASNGGAFYNQGSSAVIRSSIFQGNTAADGPAIFNSGGAPDIGYNYYHDHPGAPVSGAGPGVGSIDSTIPPGLTNPGGGNFRLTAAAAALDRGDPASPLSEDFEADLRPSNQGFDIGADELAGCYARIVRGGSPTGVIYGSPQAALANAIAGDRIDVAGLCTGAHSHDIGGALGVISQTLRIDLNNITFLGGWQTNFSQRNTVTVLDALGMGRVIYVSAGISTTVRSFDIRGGNGLNGGGNEHGGGIYSDGAALTLLDSRVYSNTAAHGGAIYLVNSPAVIAGGNRIYDNTAVHGAGIFLNNNSAPAQVYNNFIYSNDASGQGGGLHSGAGNNQLLHNTLVGNSGGSGGGVYIAAGSPTVRSNIIADNMAGSGSGAFGAVGSTPTMGYNNFHNNVAGGTAEGGPGNRSDNPGFVDPGAFDYRINIDSLMVNRGDPASPMTVDYEDHPRPGHQYPDMGADEVLGCYARIVTPAGDQSALYYSVQRAINDAAAGDTVWVDGRCVGVNDQGGDNQAIFIDKAITVDGSWLSGQADAEPPTIIDALGEGRVIRVTNGVSATVRHLDLTGGAATDGGGVYNAGSLTLEKNRLYDNNAANGGAIYLAAAGNIRNNFIYNNTATNGGGLYNSSGNSPIWHNTFVGNSSGIYVQGGSPTIGSNIVDGSSGAGIHAVSGGVNIRYNNVVNNNPNYSGAAVDQEGGISVTPLYINAAAGDYHLQLNSPGVDVGDPNSPVEDDYDGDIRPMNAGFDIGADEVGSCLIRVVGSGGVPTRDFGVLQLAIDYAETNGLTDLLVARGECSGVRERNGTEQVGYVSTNLNFFGSRARPDFTPTGDYGRNGLDAPSSHFNALGEGRVLYIAPGANPWFEQIAFVGGQANGNNGGAIYNAGDAEFENVAICQSQAENGGGFYNAAGAEASFAGSSQQVGDCLLHRILEFRDGGIEFEGTISYDSLTAVQHGGAFYNDGILDRLGGVIIRNNVAGQHGGGIYNNAVLDMQNAGIWGNAAVGDGGGVYNSATASSVILVNVAFYDNQVAGSGGGLFHNAPTTALRLYHNTFNSNFAVGEGGAIYNLATNFTLNSSIIFNNITLGSFGGIHSAGDDSDFAYNNFFANDPADSNAGVGENALLADPGLVGAFRLHQHSAVIDQADPDLIHLDDRYEEDISTRERPDGGQQSGAVSPYRSDIGAFEWVKQFSCTLTPQFTEREVAPGQATTYLIQLTNAGGADNYGPTGFRDVFTVTLASSSQGWAFLNGGNEQTVALAWNESTNLQLMVTVPITAAAGQIEQSFVQCRSASQPNATALAERVTIVAPVPAVIIIPDHEPILARPGQVITYEHTVINIGNNNDIFELIASAGPNYTNAMLVNPDGSELTETIVPLMAGEQITVLLRVTVLNDAPQGGLAAPGAVVRSTTDPEVSDAALNLILIDFAQGPRYVAQGDTADAHNNCTVATNPCATIQHAVNQASPGDAVYVAGGLYTDSLTQTVDSTVLTQTLYLNKAITITGGYSSADTFSQFQPITNSVTLSGEGVHRVIYIAEDTEVNLRGLFVENGLATQGAAIFNDNGQLTMNGVFIRQNTAVTGGGIYQAAGTLHLNSVVLAANTADSGGGLYAAGGSVILENNTFAANGVSGQGGGFYQAAGSLSLLNNIFANNASDAFYADAAVIVGDNDYNLYHNNLPNLPLSANDLEADPLFTGSYYHLSSGSPAVDSGTDYAGVFDWLDIDGQPRWMGAAVDRGADELLQEPDFVFEPLLQTATIASGSQVSYTFTLTNTGDFTDTYTLSRESVTTGGTGWGYDLQPTEISELPVGEAVTVTFVITGGSPGYQDTTTITAVSATDPNLQRSVVAQTTISQTAGVQIGFSEMGMAAPGAAISYSHWLTNTGDGPDSFSLSVADSQPNWLVEITPAATAVLTPGQMIPFTVTVTVPADAISGTVHTALIQATSQYEPTVTDTLTDSTTATAFSGGLLISPAAATYTVPDGVTAVYTHTVTSLNNFSDTVTIAVSGDPGSWPVATLTPAVTLAPFGSATISVTVETPLNSGGLTHVMPVTATSTADPLLMATAVNTTNVQLNSALLLEPDREGEAPEGGTAVYTHTLTNLGNFADSFNLTAESSQGWTSAVTPAAISDLPPGTSAVVTVTVPVPLGTPLGTADYTWITAASLNNPGVMATVTDTTTVIFEPFAGVLLEPDNSSTALAGSTIYYYHWLTNSGNVADTFTLATTSSEGWTVELDMTSITLAAGATEQIELRLTVPLGAAVGVVDTTVVTATSLLDLAVYDWATNTTTITDTVTLGVRFEPDNEGSGAPGETIFYAHTLTNLGNQADTFNFVLPPPPAGWAIAPLTPVTLQPGQQTAVTVTITIAANAQDGDLFAAEIIAVSTTDGTVWDNVWDTTTVIAEPVGAALSLTPDNAAVVNPGQSHFYTHTLTNLGNLADTVALTAASSNGWATLVSPETVNLDPGQSAMITAVLFVPGTAVDNQLDTMTVTATSGNDPAVRATAFNTTTVRIPPPTGITVYLPIIFKVPETPPPPPPGPTPTPTPTPSPTPGHLPQCILPPYGNPVGVDLVVTELLAIPNNPTVGQPVTVRVTIRNQGTVNVTPGNNFFLDAYINRIPNWFLPGDLEWGVQGAIMTAGTSQTFEATYVFSTPGDYWLYAQVDTDQNVAEVDETNNRLGGCNEHKVSVSAGSPLAVTPIVPTAPERPRHTPTPIFSPTPTMTPTPRP